MFKKSINNLMIGIISLVIIIAIGGMVAYVSSSSRDMALQLEKEALSNVADCVTRSFEDFIQSGIATAQNMAIRKSIVQAVEGGGGKEAAKIFADYVQKNKGVIAIALAFDTSSQIVAGSNINGELLTEGDRSGRPYVDAILSGKDVFISPTLINSKTTGKLIGIISVPVKDSNGKLIGGIALCPDLNVLFERHISPLRFGKGGYAFVLDNQGNVLAHPDKTNIMKNVAHVNFASYALKHKNGSTDYTLKGKEKFLVFKEVPYIHWILGLTANHSEMAASAVRQQKVLLGIGAGVILTVIIAILFISRRLIFEPLSRIVNFVNKVSHEDYQAKLEGTFKYELVALSEDIKTMVTEIKNKIGFSQGTLNAITMPFFVTDKDDKIIHLNKPLVELLRYKGKPEDYTGMALNQFVYNDPTRPTLTHKAMEEKKAMRGFEAKLPTQDGDMVDVLTDASPIYDLNGQFLAGLGLFTDMTEIKTQQSQIEEQNKKIAITAREAFAVADQMAGATEQLSAQIEQSSRGTDIQRERVTETATSMEEMNATVLEVAKNASGAAEGSDSAKTKAEQGQQIVESVIQAITQVQKQAQALKTDMEALGQQAEDIGNVMNVISDIADQTNLLALNAAIEAARAGEAGRGFAVVADEVRKLAEKTMSATKEVGDAISNIQQGTRGAATGMDQAVKSVEDATTLAGRSGEALNEIVTLVEQASDQVRSIATASEEQSASSEEINIAVGEINRISSETADAMEQSAQAVSDLARLAQELNRMIRDLQNS